jgi:hypothetical protein
MRIAGLMVALIATIACLGCTSKPASESTTSLPAGQAVASAPQGQSATPAPQPVAVPASAAPDEVVKVFLNALRSGDSPTTESLLTAKARQELAKHELSVDVQSAPNATYQVKAAEIVQGNPNGAHVSSVWTEKFDDGEETYEIVWALRRQPEGWRLAGMAMSLIPNQPMQFLNFEDPDDMLRKKEEAIAAMQPPAAETAQQPAAPATQPAPTVER